MPLAEKTTFSAKDFTQTQSGLRVRLPEKLLHRNVEGSSDAVDAAFNRERKHAVHVVDLPAVTLSMTLGGLEPGQTTNRHRHSYETMIYVLEGEGESVIEDRVIPWQAGDAFYVPVWAWHHHRNRSEKNACRYLACENAPLLQNLGRLDIREEST